MDSYPINFEPVGRRGTCRGDQSLLEAARQVGLDLISVCGGIGLCERCIVQVLAGRVSEPTPAEQQALSPRQLADGYRLACMTYPLGPCKLGVPAESLSTPLRAQVEGLEAMVAVEPALRSLPLELAPPSLSHPQADAENLLLQIKQSHDLDAEEIDLAVLQNLSARLREWNWQCQAHLRGREVVAVTPPHARPLGLAVDLGSTKIAGYLVDLQNGKTMAAQGMMNPQINYGEDIISRLSYASQSPAARHTMQEVVCAALYQLITDVCAEAGAAPEHILEAVIVGNTAMHHLLLGLPVRQLALAPFVPAVSGALDLKARDLGLSIAPGAYVHLPPNIAGFVGSDHIAMLLASAGEWPGQTVVALDIGTNTEISLITPAGKISSLSCASGPAFEGYHIKDGMRATSGAIERVRITPQDVHYQTIGGAPPAGMCGSGILDAVAQLCLAGVLNSKGRLQPGAHPRLHRDGERREFVLVEREQGAGRKEVTVTQDDIREIQLAKAAIQTGIQVLLAESGVTLPEINKVIIAGAFGTFIDIANAAAIGMFPTLPLERFKQVGNAAGMGAKLALVSTQKRAEAAALQTRVNYIELARYPNFAKIFARNCELKPYAD